MPELEDYTRVIYQEIIKLEHPYTTNKLVEFWYTFRLTDQECLEKYPDVSEIVHFKIPEKNSADQSLYEMAKDFFRSFIRHNEEEKILRVMSNDPSQMHVAFVPIENNYEIVAYNMSHESIQVHLDKLGLDQGKYLIVDILGPKLF